MRFGRPDTPNVLKSSSILLTEKRALSLLSKSNTHTIRFEVPCLISGMKIQAVPTPMVSAALPIAESTRTFGKYLRIEVEHVGSWGRIVVSPAACGTIVARTTNATPMSRDDNVVVDGRGLTSRKS